MPLVLAIRIALTTAKAFTVRNVSGEGVLGHVLPHLPRKVQQDHTSLLRRFLIAVDACKGSPKGWGACALLLCGLGSLCCTYGLTYVAPVLLYGCYYGLDCVLILWVCLYLLP
jgi:hypothetical protein